MAEKDGFMPEKYVYEYIKDRIISKELFPGSRLVEAQLVEETGVSRTPIREALKKLSYEGIVRIEPRRGAFVAIPSKHEIRSVYECKKVLETAAIQKACAGITDEELKHLYALIEKQTTAHKDKNLKDYLQYNDQFHMMIAGASNNIMLQKYIKELTEMSNVYLIFYDNFIITAVSDSEALQGHEKILDALRKRDPIEAAALMEAHNQTTLDQLSIE